ncbi:MAG: hypothetical protein V4633_13465 [Pseudomonadota bacterium]
MAARLRKTHQDDVRTKIQASQLINVLQNHALGTTEVELSPSRLKAIEILLRKSLPDLQSVEHTGPDGGPMEVTRVELIPLAP